MKELFIKAHKITRELAKQYKVNYQAQFTLCLNYLLENKKEMKEMKTLKGTEKQIKYAEDIKKEMNTVADIVIKAIEQWKVDATEDNKKQVAYKRMIEALEVLEVERDNLNKSTEAKTIIKEYEMFLRQENEYNGQYLSRFLDRRETFNYFLQKVAREGKLNTIKLAKPMELMANNLKDIDHVIRIIFFKIELKKVIIE